VHMRSNGPSGACGFSVNFIRPGGQRLIHSSLLKMFFLKTSLGMRAH
jgi:hypothetical protein